MEPESNSHAIAMKLKFCAVTCGLRGRRGNRGAYGYRITTKANARTEVLHFGRATGKQRVTVEYDMMEAGTPHSNSNRATARALCMMIPGVV